MGQVIVDTYYKIIIIYKFLNKYHTLEKLLVIKSFNQILYIG